MPSTRRPPSNLIKKEPHLICFIHLSGQNYSLSRGRRANAADCGQEKPGGRRKRRSPVATSSQRWPLPYVHLSHSLTAIRRLRCCRAFDLNWDSPSCSSNQTKLDANCPCTTQDRKRDIKFAWSHLWLTVEDSCSFALGYFCWIGF